MGRKKKIKEFGYILRIFQYMHGEIKNIIYLKDLLTGKLKILGGL